ncbi:hypothetical protein GCM10023190_14230 [Enteractinococcus fodinae]|uniref:Uncharacterized protein n=1 Tax=Enteractinococcus fodinae TaxID=684663 RepID=A0ABU2AXL9_9MICC|nr:hypothetical protein [Enteractinococcus fodinae]MDR7346100.1 hypothetical protein [Enteractinococcus fodinae]
MPRSIKAGVAAAAIAGLVLTGCARDSDVPAFDDVEPDMWESMANADAMAMTGVLPEAMASDAAIIEDMIGGNISDLQIYGSLNESATAIRLGDEDPIMSFFDDEVYVSMDMVWETMGDFLMSNASAEERDLFDRLATDFEGEYLDVSDDYNTTTDSVDVADLLEEMRSAAEEGRADDVTGFNFDDLHPEGEYAQLDRETDDTGWYYATQEMAEGDIMNGVVDEFIVLPTDRENPRLDRIRDGDTQMEFFWDEEVEIPEKPSDDQLVTEQDFMEAALGQ